MRRDLSAPVADAWHHHPVGTVRELEGQVGVSTPRLRLLRKPKKVQKVNAYLGAGVQGVCRAYGPR